MRRICKKKKLCGKNDRKGDYLLGYLITTFAKIYSGNLFQDFRKNYYFNSELGFILFFLPSYRVYNVEFSKLQN